MATEWKEPMAWENTGTEPSNTLKTNGFKAGDKPPASVFNYFLNKTAECINQLQDEVDSKSNTGHTHTLDDVSETKSKKIMTADERTKLGGIATGAEVNQNAFTNVIVGSTTIAADAKSDTLTFVEGSNIQITPDAANDKITISATNTTYNTASTSAAGLMSAADKIKLDGIETGANKTTVDSALSSSSTNPVQNKVINTALAGKSDTGHTHSAATTSSAGMMSAADKEKLNGIAAGANAYTHPASHPASMITGLAEVATTGSIDDVAETSAKKINHLVTATATDGATFTATVDGITALEAGIEVTIIPSMTATSTTPTLDINGLGAKQIRRKLSSGTITRPQVLYANVVYKSLPLKLFYDGTYWIATQFSKPSAVDIYGAVAVENGGTGLNELTAGSYLVGNGTEDVQLKTPAEVLTDIGGAPAYTYGTDDLTAGTSALETGKLYFVYE